MLRLVPFVAFALASTGCSMFHAGVAEAPMLAALADDDPTRAAKELDDGLGVENGKLPVKMHGFSGLMLAERGTVRLVASLPHQATDDFRVADRMLDVEDMALDDTMRRTHMPQGLKHAFHMGWLGALNYPYVPRLHERLMVNPLAMIAYLDLGDDQGARVEARRHQTMIDFANRTDPRSASRRTRALSGILAGFAFERAGEMAEACRDYREAMSATTSDLTSLVPGGKDPSACSGPAFVGDGKGHGPPLLQSGGELLVVVGYGLAPRADMNSGKTDTQLYDIARGSETLETPRIIVDGEAVTGVEVLDLGAVVQADWDEANRATGNGTPLSWANLPAHFYVARVAVEAGKHHVETTVREATRKTDLLVPAGGWAATSAFVLR
ncbi:MAG: hypothetical protein ABI551_08220 [Polyangiaceae bacterium]